MSLMICKQIIAAREQACACSLVTVELAIGVTTAEAV
jgi:hypothetical protein